MSATTQVHDPFGGFPVTVNRREFLKLVGSGIVVVVTTRGALQAQDAGGGDRPDFNAFVRVGEDGTVTCLTGKIEMGQGVVTSLPQMLAEELEVPVDSVQIVMGDTDQCPFDQGTWGSLSTRVFGIALLHAAAEAREALRELGAEHLGVKPEQVQIQDGHVVDRSDDARRVSYGELARGKAIRRTVSHEVALKSFRDSKVMGKPRKRVDARAKVTGEAKYAGDIRLPGMLYARILRPPAHGATLKKVDTTPAEAVPGARVVRDGDLIAVLHETPDGAERAREKIQATFDVPDSSLNEDTIFDHLLQVAPPGETLESGGDLSQGEAKARGAIESTYLDGYVAHAPMETHTAVALAEEDSVTLWAATQTPFGVRSAVSRALGLPQEKVRVITPFVGGGFGGKGRGDQVIEAARLARAVGRPIHLEYTRDEEFFYDAFRPAAVVKIRSGVNEAGAVSFWDYAVYFAGARGAANFYDMANHRTVVHSARWGGGPGTHPFATGPWRAPANNTNTWARESQIAMMAARAGKDPLEFRLAHLTDERMRRVLQAAAKQFGWKPAAAPSGLGRGIACGIDAGTYVALMAEVEVDKGTGGVQVKRVVCAQDMGLVVNPDGATMQVEGCINMGLGYTLSEELRFRGGNILDRNFDTYELPRFSWVPRIETVLLDGGDAPPQGGGEPAIICMGGVVANAIFDAVGARVFRLPMTPERVRAALEAAGD